MKSVRHRPRATSVNDDKSQEFREFGPLITALFSATYGEAKINKCEEKGRKVCRQIRMYHKIKVTDGALLEMTAKC